MLLFHLPQVSGIAWDPYVTPDDKGSKSHPLTPHVPLPPGKTVFLCLFLVVGWYPA